jgi:FlaA1/EpsC-like NDP-sugar epimerase
MFFKTLFNLPRAKKQTIILIVDLFLLLMSILISLSISHGYKYLFSSNLNWIIFLLPISSIPIFLKFGLYHSIIRHIGNGTFWPITLSVTLYSLLLGLVNYFFAIEGLTYVTLLFNLIISILIITASRFFFRYIIRIKTSTNNKCKVLIYGAGNAGVQLNSALNQSFEYKPVGFIDDSKELQGSQINGLKVYSINDLNDLIKKNKVEEVLIAMPSVSRAKRRAVIDILENYPILVRALPGVAEIAQGKVTISDIREISIQDLIGRDLPKKNNNLLASNVLNKVVLITGAGGSIGTELCRQVILLKPKMLILYEINELALYTIEKELSKNSNNQINILPVLGCIKNKNRLSRVLSCFDVNTIYHAAAYKHVPIVEFNSSEGVENNIFGTLNCALMAIKMNVETFVLISSDKAVRPTNTMGATKRISELILQALSSNQNETKFSIVRFGNVIGSSGSVIPLFKEQIQSGGPVTVTDKNIIRYFMTIPEAVELVIEAGAMSQGGDLFLLDMGKPVRIQELAEKMIRLSGLEVKNKSNPKGDIEIIYTGLRAGEKLYEELLIGDDSIGTDNPRIMRAKEEMLGWNELESLLSSLSDAASSSNFKRLREILIQIVPNFKPDSNINDILYKN